MFIDRIKTATLIFVQRSCLFLFVCFTLIFTTWMRRHERSMMPGLRPRTPGRYWHFWPSRPTTSIVTKYKGKTRQEAYYVMSDRCSNSKTGYIVVIVLLSVLFVTV